MVTQFPVSNGNVIEDTDVNSAYYQAALAATLNHASINIGSSEVVIKAANSSRKTILIKNNGTSSLFLGPTGLATTDGFELPAGESILLNNKEAIYGITASATIDVRYLEAE